MKIAVALARIHKRLAKIIIYFKIRGSDMTNFIEIYVIRARNINPTC